MVIIYGTRFMGMIDHAPGQFHVATQFFHINFVPLVPLETWVVLDNTGNEIVGRKIPMSLRSVMMAYLRVGLLLMMCVGMMGILVSLGCADGVAIGPLVASVSTLLAASGLFRGSYRWSQASPRRTEELRALAGIPRPVPHPAPIPRSTPRDLAAADASAVTCPDCHAALPTARFLEIHVRRCRAKAALAERSMIRPVTTESGRMR